MIAARTLRAASSMCPIQPLNLWESWGEASRRSNLTSFTKGAPPWQGEASRPPERDQGTSALGRGCHSAGTNSGNPCEHIIDVIGNHCAQTTLAQLYRPNERRF